MADNPPWQSQSRAEARRSLWPQLAEIGLPLRLLAEEIRGDEEAVIDWVGAETDGRLVVALLNLDSGDGTLLLEGLAQRAWVAARLPDWLKLAPGLGVRPDLRPALLLIAPRFPRKVRIAAREADPAGIWLARFGRPGAAEKPVLELVRTPERSDRPVGDADASPAARFRTGLSEDELGLSPDERASLS